MNMSFSSHVIDLIQIIEKTIRDKASFIGDEELGQIYTLAHGLLEQIEDLKKGKSLPVVENKIVGFDPLHLA